MPDSGSVVVRSEQDSRLTSTGLGGEVRLPLAEPVAIVGHPTRHVRRAPVAHSLLQHGQRKPIDLKEHDPGCIRARLHALSPRDALQHAHRVLVVVVGPRDDLEQDRDSRHHQRCQQGVSERVDPDEVRQQLVGKQQQEGIDDQHQHEAEREHERQPQRGDEGRHYRVEDGDDGRHGECGTRPFEGESGHQDGGDVERRGRNGPRDQQAQRAQAWLRRLPPHRLAVCCRSHA
jgi:hypothetical protein